MEKNELLNKIRNTYFYEIKRQDAEQILKAFQSKSNSLGEQVSNIDRQVNNLKKFRDSVDSLEIEPQLVKPEVSVNKIPSYIVGFFVFFILFELSNTISNSIAKSHISAGAYNTGAPISVTLFLLIISLVLGIILGKVLYKRMKQVKYNKLYEEYNAPRRKQAKNVTAGFKNQVKGIDNNIDTLLQAKNNIEKIKANIDNKLIPDAKSNITQLENNDIDLIKVPSKHEDNPDYYLSLFEIIDTDQAKELGEAIKIAEDRYQRAELNADLKTQLVASQKAIENTIRQTANNISQSLNKINTNISGLNNGFKEVNQSLQGVNNSINYVNQTIATQGELIQTQLRMNNANSIALNSQLQDLQNTADYISDTMRK